MLLVCKDCREEFEIKDDELQWYKDKNYEIPKRCRACRQARKQKREEE